MHIYVDIYIYIHTSNNTESIKEFNPRGLWAPCLGGHLCACSHMDMEMVMDMDIDIDMGVDMGMGMDMICICKYTRIHLPQNLNSLKWKS